MMLDAFICDAIRTPFGRYGGALSAVRADDLAAIPLAALPVRNPQLDAALIDDVILGCANQAGEDNRNVARMALLLAGLPETVPGLTLNRLCGSGLDAIAAASRMIRSGEADLVLAGGVESMSRAPFVIGKASSPFGRDVQMFDTTMGWRFVNPRLEERHGVDTMPQTAENVAARFNISRKDQDLFALRSQERALAAQAQGLFASEIVAVAVAGEKGETHCVDRDEHPRVTSLEALSRLPTPFREGGSVTAGNSSGINDGAAAVLVASEAAVRRHGLTPRARVLGIALAGVEPRIMGMGPVPATNKLLTRLQLPLSAFAVIELNEAFAAQALAVLRALGVPDDAAHVNAYGGAIALGHPLGASGARLVTTALNRLARTGGRRALCTMCIGVGQGIALAMESVA
jgi:3-oxoadipyl-CoA thiolase